MRTKPVTEIDRTIVLNGELISLREPKVMGILNVTPDSFYAESRTQTEEAVAARAEQIAAQGGAIIDVGAYSSRPGAVDVDVKEEMRRLRTGLEVIRRIVPDVPLSVDTFRADVARMCVEEYGVAMVNDISGGELDADMFRTVARLHVPYVLMHMKGCPRDMQVSPHYEDVRTELLQYFVHKIAALADLGVCDVVVDPGFGFGKSMEHNYELLAHLDDFDILERPLLVGLSRKSMIYDVLETSAVEALNGTTVLNTVAVLKGADFLRVHDVRAAVEVVRLVGKLKGGGLRCR